MNLKVNQTIHHTQIHFIVTYWYPTHSPLTSPHSKLSRYVLGRNQVAPGWGRAHAPCGLLLPSPRVVGIPLDWGSKWLQSRVPTPLAWLHGPFVGEESHTHLFFHRFGFVIILYEHLPLKILYTGIFFFLILILPLVFILFNTFCISHFLIFHWLLSQVKTIYVTLYFLGKELCLTMLVFRER